MTPNSPNSDNKKTVGSGRRSALARLERTHPLLMLLYLGLIGVSVLFVILVSAYLQARTWAPAVARPFPRFFGLSTVVVLLSSITLLPAARHYRKDNLRRLNTALGFTLLLGLAFVATQLLAWREMLLAGAYFRGTPTNSYVYLISALHAAHLLAGVGFLAYFYFVTRRASRDAVRALFFIRNPYRRLQLRLLRLYWHYLAALWVMLFVLFLFVL